jgi:hypothetical protein
MLNYLPDDSDRVRVRDLMASARRPQQLEAERSQKERLAEWHAVELERLRREIARESIRV